MGLDPTEAHATGRAGTLRERLRRALPAAIKARDDVAVAALRSAIAAIENAEALGVERAPAWPPLAFDSGAAEVERRALTEPETERIVRAETDDRHRAANEYERAGALARAERLRAEAAVLASHLEPAI